MTIRTLLIGLGKIGFQYSYPHHNQEVVLTHTSAILENSNFELIYAIDPDENARNKFTGLTNIPSMRSVSELTLTEKLDLVVIATPTVCHEQNLKEILNFQPKVVLMEKPLSDNHESAMRMKELIEGTGTKIFMNFQRSYTREITEISNKILAGKFPRPYHFNFRYSGEPMNAGSHIFSIIATLFPDEYRLICKDGKGSCLMYSDKFSAKILVERVEGFKGNIFEFNLITSHQEMKYNSTLGTVIHRDLENQKYYENEKTLEPAGKVKKLHEETALREVYAQLQDYFLLGKDKLLDLQHGLTNILLVERFLEGS